MYRLVALLEIADRPGLLQEVSKAITSLGGNIIVSLGYVADSTAYLLFIFDSPLSEDHAKMTLEESLEAEGSIDVRRLGSGSAELLASFVEARLGFIGVLESYLDPADVLDLILRMPEDVRSRAYRFLSPATLASILEDADPAIVEEIIDSVGITTLARALRELDPDEIVDILQKMPEAARKRAIMLLPREYRAQASELLAYPPDTAGGVMTTSVPILRADETVHDALQRLKSGEYDVRDLVVVVNHERRLVGTLEAGDLLLYPPNTRLGPIARKPRTVVTPEVDQEEAARIMLRYYLKRLPVVNEEGEFLGVIAIEDIAYVLAEEASEDIAKIAGLGMALEKYLTARLRDMVRVRLPWLLAIYLFQNLTAGLLRHYESLIAASAILAAFIPLVMGTGGNVGSQAVAIMVRALALGEVSERSRADVAMVVAKELSVSLIIGAVFALAGFTTGYVISGGNLTISLIVGSTLLVVILVSDISGALLPLIARRLGIDPASVSTPLITTLVDLSVAAIYMTIASLILT